MRNPMKQKHFTFKREQNIISSLRLSPWRLKSDKAECSDLLSDQIVIMLF